MWQGDAHDVPKGTQMARAAKKSAARRTTTKKVAASRGRVTTRRRAPAAAPTKATAATAAKAAPAAGTADLAGGLRQLLAAVEAEVREVTALSGRIDSLVEELNSRRDDQAKRLLVLDELRGSVRDASLGAFLDKAIRPRKTQVAEVIPERLTQG
jgi:hypothetical protein